MLCRIVNGWNYSSFSAPTQNADNPLSTPPQMLGPTAFTSVSLATADRTSSSVCCPIATSFNLDIRSARSFDLSVCFA